MFDEQLATIHRIWSGEPLSIEIGAIGPTPTQAGGPEILIGGGAPASLQRLARRGNGFIAGGGGPQMANQGFRAAEAIWSTAGRAGKPHLVACGYYALGPDAQTSGANYLHHYYGPEWGPLITQGLLATPEAIKDAIKAFADIGADELILWPCLSAFDQLDRLEDTLS